MEDTGAGAVTRWWMTGISGATLNNNLRIYIDGAATPTVTQTANTLFGGNNNGFGGSLNYSTPALGGNLYAPITYNQSIKITWDGASPHGAGTLDGSPPTPTHNLTDATWYNIDYRKYDSAATVTSFQTSDTATYATQLSGANTSLAGANVTGSVTQQYQSGTQTLADRQAITRNLAGTGAIRRLKINVSGADQIAALNNTYVELTFDGQQTARVPVNQFFGNGDSQSSGNLYNEYTDAYRSVASNGDMTAVWVMPFQTAAEVRIVNESGQSVDVAFEVDSGNWSWDSNSMHFHANYRAETQIGTNAATNSYSSEGDADFRFIDIRGRGVFVGDTLALRNRSDTGGNQWWGEGDEKIYVDYLEPNGDGSAATPDHVGTGTEDYYGYSFGSSTTFDSAFVSQPNGSANGGGTGGLTVNSRVRGLDAIPFEQSFKFDMEIWKWVAGEVDFGATTFWYGAPGSTALTVAADLATDFRAGVSNGDLANGITDTAGDGQWMYLGSSDANPNDAGATTSPLAWGAVGNVGNSGYGGGQNAYNLTAISDRFLFVDGGDNLGIQGGPGYHELAMHAGGDGATQPYIIARWVAGASSIGLANINGSIRNFIDNGDSVDLHIFVDGVLKYEVLATGTQLPQSYFDFDVLLAADSVVDFVLGNGSADNLFGDESLLRATIRVADFNALANSTPTPTALSAGLALVGLFAARRRR